MPPFSVKVCGMKRTEDALKAVELGAELIGLIFYEKSPRFVSRRQARDICEAVSPGVICVGVFVNMALDEMLEIAQAVGLNRLQVHGELTNDSMDRIHEAGLTVIQPFHIQGVGDYEQVYASQADFVMLDNATKMMPGGTGRSFDWTLKPPRRIDRLILAGGVSEANVEEGVRVFQPVIVDVNSGVEHAPGVKSHRKLERFFDECKRIWRESNS